MSNTIVINYPPQEIKGIKKNFEYNILWMLHNNPYCSWNDFLDKRLGISQSTLSVNLKKLIDDLFVEKINKEVAGKRQKIYQITSKGREKYEQILTKKKGKERQINYPSQKYLALKDNEINILFMLHNNSYCNWKDFLEGPFHINQSVLAKNLKYFLSQGLAQKEKIEDSKFEIYKITETGTKYYIEKLNSLNFDRQSILDEESKRIQDIIKNSEELFKVFSITNDEVKFRLLTYILNVDFSNVKGTSCTEEQFQKILYFIALNHPDEYPKYISPEDFSKKFNLDLETLKFFLQDIVDKNQFSIKFLKLKVKPNKEYVFQVNEELEKTLRAIVENVIKKLRFLNVQYNKTNLENNVLDYFEIEQKILDKISGKLFHKSLKESLVNFLPEYITYLKYITEKKELTKDTRDKQKIIAFRDVPDNFQKKRPKFRLEQKKSTIDNSLKLESIENKDSSNDKTKEYMESVLEDLNNVIRLKPKSEYYHKKFLLLRALERYEEALETIEKTIVLEHFSYTKDVVLKEISYYYKAVILKDLTRDEEALDAINKAIEYNKKWPEYYYFKADVIYEQFNSKTLQDSLEAINKAIALNSNNDNYWQLKARILNDLDRFEEAIETVNKTIELAPNWWGHYSVKAAILSSYDRFEETIEALNKAIELQPNADLFFTKAVTLLDLKKYEDALISIDKAIELNPEDLYNYDIKIDILSKLKKYDMALKIINELIVSYPDQLLVYNIKFGILKEIKNYDEGLKLIDETIELFPEHSYLIVNKAKLLFEMNKYKEAIDVINKAIEINPDLDSIKQKVNFLFKLEKYDEALDLCDEYILQVKDSEYKKKLLKVKFYCLKKIQRYDEALSEIEKEIDLNPEDSQLYISKADVLLKMKEFDISIQVIEKAKDLDPLNPDINYKYGKILFNMKKYREAIDQFEEGLKLSYHRAFNYKFYVRIGQCYKELGEYNNAVKNFKKGKEIAEDKGEEKAIKKIEKYILEIKKQKNKK